jgi:hypothetical protein
MSICSQLAPFEIVVEHSFPKSAKSADRIEGAIIAAGDIVVEEFVVWPTIVGSRSKIDIREGDCSES